MLKRSLLRVSSVKSVIKTRLVLYSLSSSAHNTFQCCSFSSVGTSNKKDSKNTVSGSTSNDLRQKFLQNAKTSSFRYMDMVNIPVSSETHCGKTSGFYSRYLIPAVVPEQLSNIGKDIWARIQQNKKDLISLNWIYMIQNEDADEFRDEGFMCRKQFDKKVANGVLTAEETDIIKEALEELEELWSVALDFELAGSFLEDLKNKFHNDYVFPTNDSGDISHIMDYCVYVMKEYSGNDIIQKKLQDLVFNLSFLEETIYLPMLRYRYPEFFK